MTDLTLEKLMEAKEEILTPSTPEEIELSGIYSWSQLKDYMEKKKIPNFPEEIEE